MFSTVGLGDITAKTDAARLLVTGQMVVGIVIIGFVVTAISYAVKLRRAKQQKNPGHHPGRGNGHLEELHGTTLGRSALTGARPAARHTAISG